MKTVGQRLHDLRHRQQLTQEEVAHSVHVSRQTISKWEMDQSVPEAGKLKALCELYQVSYDYLLEGQKGTGSSNAQVEDVDWTAVWSRQYPILAKYKNIPHIEIYRKRIEELYEDCKKDYQLSDEDTVLILKDMLYQTFKRK